MRPVKKYASGGKVKSGCGCGKAKCNCKSYAKGGIVSATGPSDVNYDSPTKKLNTRTGRAGKTDTAAVVRSVSGCGHKATKSRGSTQAASNCVSPQKRLSNVGSSREWKRNKRDEKKNERKAHRAVKKAARQENRAENKAERQENRAERQAEKDKKKRTYRYVSPRFM